MIKAIQRNMSSLGHSASKLAASTFPIRQRKKTVLSGARNQQRENGPNTTVQDQPRLDHKPKKQDTIRIAGHRTPTRRPRDAKPEVMDTASDSTASADDLLLEAKALLKTELNLGALDKDISGLQNLSERLQSGAYGLYIIHASLDAHSRRISAAEQHHFDTLFRANNSAAYRAALDEKCEQLKQLRNGPPVAQMTPGIDSASVDAPVIIKISRDTAAIVDAKSIDKAIGMIQIGLKQLKADWMTLGRFNAIWEKEAGDRFGAEERAHLSKLFENNNEPAIRSTLTEKLRQLQDLKAEMVKA